MVRRDLTNEEIERMGREEPGSAAAYLEERRKEIEAERVKAREEDDKARYVEAFVRAGGNKSDAEAAFKAHQNEVAASAARGADQEAAHSTRQRIRSSL